MSYTYADRRRAGTAVPVRESEPQPSLDELRSGAAAPTQEQMGRRVDLPDAMREKMEAAFGADLSAVKLYESQSVADAGAEAVTRGSDIAFAPGLLDFSSFGGQALLGHELSHVVSQARGEVAQRGGFLNDPALEARADREGAMAAAGQQFAMPTAALSSVSAASAAGPMQASKAEDKVNQARNTQADTVKSMVRMQHANPGYANAPEYKALQKSLSKAQAKDAKWSRRLGPDADLPSVGMRTLDALSSASRRSDPFSYFDDADAAMDILGIDQPDAPMGKRLSSETASAISDAEERVRDRQGHIDTMGARNHTFTSANQYTNLPAEVAAQVSGISRLKRFAFRRGLDLGDDS